MQIDTFIGIGNWASGKTTILNALQFNLKVDGRTVIFESDRHWFEDAVRKDVAGGARDTDGSIRGEHSILVCDGPRGNMKFRVLNGMPFNQAHRQMIESISNRIREDGSILVMEYTIGPTASFEGEALDQSARFLVENLVRSGAIDRTMVFEFDAPFEERRFRNTYRERATDQKAFDLYARPGGEMTTEDALLMGNHYFRIDTTGVPPESLTTMLWVDFIRPNIINENHQRGSEGHLRRGASIEAE